MRTGDYSSLAKVALTALGVALLVTVVCLAWGDDDQPVSRETVDETERALQQEGRLPEVSSDPWPARHPFASGLIAGGVVLVIGGVVVYYQRD